MADIDIIINSAPVAIAVSAAQGPAGVSGAGSFATLSDKTSADLPAINTPLTTALGLKADLNAPSFTGVIEIDGGIELIGNFGTDGDITANSVLAGNLSGTNTGDDAVNSLYSGLAASKLSAASNLSDLASASTAKSNLGLGNVSNTSDANKPVSTAHQAALDLKANLASPTFTGEIAMTTTQGPVSGMINQAYYRLIHSNTGLGAQDGKLSLRYQGTARFSVSGSGADVVGLLTTTSAIKAGMFTVGTTPTHVTGSEILISSASGATVGAAVTTGGGSQLVKAASNGTAWICTAIIIP